MKKAIYLLFFLVSTQSFARPIPFIDSNDESERLNRVGACENYDKAAMESIYNWYESVDKKLVADAYGRRDCDIQYQKLMEKNDSQLVISEQSALFRLNCGSFDILSSEELADLSKQRSSDSYSYVASFKSRALFTSAHMTNFRMSCSQAKQNIENLKATLKIK